MSDLVVNGERVEASKENIQPLKKGRAVSALNTVLSTPLKERSSVFESEKARFEQMIASYTGDEPLNLWIEYVNWLEQNSPSGSPELGLLLKRATLQFQENEKYRNNLKYLKLWIRYVSCHIY